MKTVAIIPARIGSKRIPKKNIRLFLGKPMISYSIEAAKESGVFDRVLVSTDSPEIASIANEYGAETPFLRPPELSGDHTTTDEVLLHSLSWLNTNWGQTDYVCLLYSTPFARSEYIKKGLELLIGEKATTAFTVTTFPYPIFRAMKVDGRGRMDMFWPENRLRRSQDLPEAFHDAAQFYWVDSRKYAADKHLFSSDAIPIILPRKYAQDIDTQEDWERAEIMYTALKSEDK
ncbi:MAG: pseudaminic acid cytidylyltransferase [Lentisphaerae bacterium]|nr:pseudaminic acid cytidylyltransferase [Lentisphaerota bacterium]